MSTFSVASKSPYTFLGSLASKVAPLASQANSAISSFGNIASLAKSSFVSLLPGAKAAENGADVAADVAYTEENCPELADIGGVGGAFCEAYIISDMSTIEEDPAEIVAKVDQLGSDVSNFADVDPNDENAVPVIKEDSNLAKYVTYCGQRESLWGFADQNVANNITDDYSTGNMVGDQIIGSIPVIGDVLSIAEEKKTLDNFGYISGESCVTNNNAKTAAFSDTSMSFEESISWDETKYYQRFIEDQRQAEAEGDIEESAVSEYLSRYYEKHPLDNSFEGILARRSGMTKENVELALNYIEVFNFVANYRPADLLPTPKPDLDETKLRFDTDTDLTRSDYLASGLLRIVPRREQYTIA